MSVLITYTVSLGHVKGDAVKSPCLREVSVPIDEVLCPLGVQTKLRKHQRGFQERFALLCRQVSRRTGDMWPPPVYLCTCCIRRKEGSGCTVGFRHEGLYQASVRVELRASNGPSLWWRGGERASIGRTILSLPTPKGGCVR